MSSQSQRRPLLELPLERFVQSCSSSTSNLTPKPITHAQSSRNTFTRHSRIRSSESNSWLSPSEHKAVVPEVFRSPEGLASPGLSLSPPDSIGGCVPRCSLLRRSFAVTPDSEPPGGGRFMSLSRLIYVDDDSRAGSKVKIPDSQIASGSNTAPIPPPSVDPHPLAPSPEIRLCNPRSSSYVLEGVSDSSTVITYSSNPNVLDVSLTPKRRLRETSSSSCHYPGFDIASDSSSHFTPRWSTSDTVIDSESVYDEDEDKENALSLPSRRPRGSKRKMEPVAEGPELKNDVAIEEMQRTFGPGGRLSSSPRHSAFRRLRPNGVSQF